MANKKLWVGILAMVLVFGMTVIGCDNGTIGNVNGGDPGLGDELNNVDLPGLTVSLYNQILNAAGGEPQDRESGDGWMELEWTGRNVNYLNAVANLLEGVFGQHDRWSSDDGWHGAYGDGWSLELSPGGTMWLFLGEGGDGGEVVVPDWGD